MSQTIRERILSGAAEVFAREGFERATIGDVAKQAGVAPATIYRHFANKEQLFAALGRPELRGSESTTHRQRILDAALDLFSLQGYQGTTLTAVAAAAGVARATLYSEFPTKEAILLGVMNENPVMDWAAGVGRRDAVRDPQRDLATLAERIIIQEQDPRRLALVRLLVAEGVRFPALQEHYHHGEAQVFARLADYLHSLLPDIPDPTFAARLFLAGLLGLVRTGLVPGGSAPVLPSAELAAKVAAAMLHGLAGQPQSVPQEVSANDSPRS